jgi:hypothetical protein
MGSICVFRFTVSHPSLSCLMTTLVSIIIVFLVSSTNDYAFKSLDCRLFSQILGKEAMI